MRIQTASLTRWACAGRSVVTLRALIVVCAATVCVSCYESDVPLDASPTMELESRLLGSWRCLGSPGEIDGKAITFVVGRARERVYVLSGLEKDKDADRMEAYLSSVSEVTLLNVLSDPDGTKPWWFARYSFPEPDILHMQVLADTLFDKSDLSTSARLRAKIEELSQEPSLYMDLFVCVRVLPRP